MTTGGDLASRRSRVRRGVKWVFGLAGLLLVLIVAPLVLFAFPQPLTPHSARAANVTIRYDGPARAEIDRLASEVHQRLSSCSLFGPSPHGRAFFIRNQNLFSVFARLARVPRQAQGFALSSVGNAFVSETNVKVLGSRTGGVPKYSIWEGDAAHTIAHEIAHLLLTDLIGRARWTRLPHWKQEGIPEYAANIGKIREDVTEDLHSRVRILRNDLNWSSTQRWDRKHYEAGLLIEFLIEVDGRPLAEILQDRVTREDTLARLLTWTG